MKTIDWKIKKVRNNNMRNGMVDFVMAFMLLFVTFVLMLFLVLGFRNSVKIESYLDAVATQGVRILAIENDENEVITLANTLKMTAIETVDIDDLTCSVGSGDRVVHLVIQVDYEVPVLGSKTFKSSAAAYNEDQNQELNCTLLLGVS